MVKGRLGKPLHQSVQKESEHLVMYQADLFEQKDTGLLWQDTFDFQAMKTTALI
jgi:hypothetical protein